MFTTVLRVSVNDVLEKEQKHTAVYLYMMPSQKGNMNFKSVIYHPANRES